MNRFAAAGVAFIVGISTTPSKAKTMFTLALEDTVEVPVKFTLKVGKVNKAFAFTLDATRHTQDEIEEWTTDKNRKIKDILTDVVTGWSGQKLVLGENKEPADFTPESFAAMLGVQGVAGTIYVAYLNECGAKVRS